MKPLENKSIRLRSGIVGFLFVLIFAVIGAKAVYIQIYRGPWLSQKAANQYERAYVSHGKRGIIYDKGKHPLAVSISVTSVAAYPAKIKDAHRASKILAKTLNINQKTIKRSLTVDKSFVWIKRHVTPREVKSTKAFSIPGIDFIPEHSRFYPNKTLAAQALGFSGIDGNGLEGVEFYYDPQLKGAKDRFRIFRDGLGKGFAAEKKISTDDSGNHLILTIDRTIQFIAESILEETVDQFSARSGMVVIMVPQTGAILALAHYPFFNPNAFRDYGRELWRNRVITDPFEPGSTMKIFSAAAALESGKIFPDSLFFCENGAYKIGADVIHDSKPRGWLSLHHIIQYSSNIGAVKLGEKMGPQYLYKTLTNFGFGTKTKIDCPGETAGSLAHYKRWSKIDIGAISFGQGISVSALQLSTAVSAIANNGILMKPHIVQTIIDPDGRTLKRFSPKRVRRVVSTKTALNVKKMMRSVITNGTGKQAAVEGYSVCGKTGTAQKIDKNGTYALEKFTASFVGFAPAGSPEITIIVIIDEPETQHYGGIVAAPAFKKIAQRTLGYLNIPPEGQKSRLLAYKDDEV